MTSSHPIEHAVGDSWATAGNQELSSQELSSRELEQLSGGVAYATGRYFADLSSLLTQSPGRVALAAQSILRARPY